MGIRLTDDEAWAFLAESHTGILTTLRRDGSPVTLPVWHVVDDHAIYVGTPEKTKKVARIRHDERASFLVEAGEAWVDLTAVQVQVRARVLDGDVDRQEISRISELFDDKYSAFRPAAVSMPKATTEHYQGQAYIRLDLAGKFLTWDNSRIRLSR